MVNVLVIGAGAQGGPCTSILTSENIVEEIRLGDINLDSQMFFAGMADRGIPFELDEIVIKHTMVN